MMELAERSGEQPTVRDFLDILAREGKSFKVYPGRGWQVIRLVPQ